MAGFWFSQSTDDETAEPKILGLPAKKFWIILGLVVLALVLIAVLVAVLCILLIPSNEASATEVKDKMNLSADPCADFHEFACGGWLSSDGVKNSEVPVSLVGSMQDDMKIRILELLKKPMKEGDPIFKVKPMQFFRACNNIERLKERGKQPFLDFLKQFDHLPVVGVNNGSSIPAEEKDIQELVTKVVPLGSVCFFTVYTYEDPDGDALYFRQLPYKTDHESQLAVEKWFRSALKELGFDPDKVDYQSLMSFEDSIQKSPSDKRMNIFLELPSVTAKVTWMNISKLFNDLTKDAIGQKIYAEEFKILVENIGQFEKSSITSDENTSPAKRNMPLCILRDLLKFTSALYPDFPQFPLGYNVLGSSLPPNHTREERCLTETMELFPELVHRLYFEEYKPADSVVSFIKDMLEAEKAQFSRQVEKNKKAYDNIHGGVRMVAGMKAEMGYPDEIKHLEKMYAEIPANDYFEAVVALVRSRYNIDIQNAYGDYMRVWRWKFPWKHYTRLIIDDIYDFGPYIIKKDTFAIPTEMIRVPIFDSNWRSSMKFGALGSLLGSRLYKVATLSEGFFLPEDYRKCYQASFNDKSFQNQKISVSPDSLKIELFLLDLAGIELSNVAYEKFQEGKGEETRLPGLDFTPAQLFFISYAQMMCEKIPGDLTAITLSKPQMPFQFRVNENLRHADSFRRAFGCSNASVVLSCPRY